VTSKLLSHISIERRLYSVNAESEPITDAGTKAGPVDFEAIFHAQYFHIAKVIGRIVNDPDRAEELAIEVFWKFWRHPGVQESNLSGWLYRTAVRIGLDELRRTLRREKYEGMFELFRTNPTPEQIHKQNEEQQRVQTILAKLKTRDAELLLLRSDGTAYAEIAKALDLNASSIGTLLIRAQQAFRKEYVKRYGPQD
jgi:RNA polymerase sigma-70 factor (ECF subfamily)